MAKLIRVTTVPIALKYLLTGQMRYMKEHGFDVIMISADGKERESIMQNENCLHIIIPLTRRITPFTDLKSLWALYRVLQKEKPDIVHSHTPKAGLIAMLAAKMAGVKIRIHTVAGLRFMTSTGMTRKLLIQMERLTCKWATHVWPNSFSLMKYIRSNKLASEKKLEVIGLGSSNGINLSRFSLSSLNAEKLKSTKELIHYDEQLTYFLCVGRIVKDKGIHELLYAFTRIYEQNKNIRLVLVGTFEKDLDPISEEDDHILKTHPGIILAGWSEDVEYFMSLSFALVHPSYREGFPNVLLQAGAMLCPVICSRIEGNIDLIEDEMTGLIFEPKNKEQLLQALEKALTAPFVLKQYSAALRQKIENYFDQKILHKTLNQKYKDLLSVRITG